MPIPFPTIEKPVVPAAEAELRQAAAGLRAMTRYLAEPAFLANIQTWVREELFAASLDLINADRALQVLGGGDRCGRGTLTAAVKAGILTEYHLASGVRYSRRQIEDAILDGKFESKINEKI
jgi:hypothetical protein